MSVTRREFIQMLALAGAAGMGLAGGRGVARAANPNTYYDVPVFGNVSLLHYTDCHAQLVPVYFREPNINIGVGGARGQPPHLVGEALLKHFGIPPWFHGGTCVHLPQLRGGRAPLR